MYTTLIICIIIFLVILVPIKIKINYEYYSKDYDINDEDTKKEIKIYILRFIKIKTIKKLKREKSNSKNDTNNKLIYNIFSIYKKYKQIIKNEKELGNRNLEKLKRNIKFQELDLSIGYNTKNIILNSYIVAILNAFINSYISKNIDSFNIYDTRYETYISENLLKIRIKSIVNLNLVNTIYIILKLIIKYMKGGKNNGKKTSNRKFNDDCYDFS